MCEGWQSNLSEHFLYEDDLVTVIIFTIELNSNTVVASSRSSVKVKLAARYNDTHSKIKFGHQNTARNIQNALNSAPVPVLRQLTAVFPHHIRVQIQSTSLNEQRSTDPSSAHFEHPVGIF